MLTVKTNGVLQFNNTLPEHTLNEALTKPIPDGEPSRGQVETFS